MLDALHIWYIAVSTVIVAALLALFRFAPFFQKERAKNLTLFFIALACYLTHSSELWLAVPLGVVDIGDASLANIAIVSPCAAAMLAFLIVGFMAATGRGGYFGKWLAAGTAYVGFFGAVTTVYLSLFRTDVDFFADWFWTANMISHSLLLLGCVYLFTGSFIKIKCSNILPVIAFGLGCAAIGGVGIFFEYFVFKAEEPENPMYMLRPIFGVEPFNGWVILGTAVGITLVFTLFYEFCFVKSRHRFYKNWTKDYWLCQ
jgi:hypothetical protein